MIIDNHMHIFPHLGGASGFDSVAGLKVAFTRGGETALSAATDEIGEFRITGVTRGTYDLRIELLEGGLDVPDLSVGEY